MEIQTGSGFSHLEKALKTLGMVEQHNDLVYERVKKMAATVSIFVLTVASSNPFQDPCP